MVLIFPAIRVKREQALQESDSRTGHRFQKQFQETSFRAGAGHMRPPTESVRAGSPDPEADKAVLLLASYLVVVHQMHQVNVRLIKRENLIEVRKVLTEDLP